MITVHVFTNSEYHLESMHNYVTRLPLISNCMLVSDIILIVQKQNFRDTFLAALYSGYKAKLAEVKMLLLFFETPTSYQKNF